MKVTAQHILAVHEEATAIEVPKTALIKGFDIAKFPALYQSTVRPVMLSVVALLKLLRRGDAANAISTAVVYLDLAVGGQLPQ